MSLSYICIVGKLPMRRISLRQPLNSKELWLSPKTYRQMMSWALSGLKGWKLGENERTSTVHTSMVCAKNGFQSYKNSCSDTTCKAKKSCDSLKFDRRERQYPCEICKNQWDLVDWLGENPTYRLVLTAHPNFFRKYLRRY
jgi:hypothetical protein